MGHNYLAPLQENSLNVLSMKKHNLSVSTPSFRSITCVSHITETHSRDAISMSPAVVWTGLGDVDSIQSKRWRISINTALLEPAEPGFTGNWKEDNWICAEMEQMLLPLCSDGI